MFKPIDPNIDFPLMERTWLEKWYAEGGLVEQYLHKNDKVDKKFSFMDGPITANGYMGVHHGWGRSYKDLWQKFHNLLGYKQRFQNGFDCQGLWVEVEVEKELKLHSKKDIDNLVPGDKKASIAKFVQMCKDRVYKFSDIQTNQSKRLGYFMDWDHSYFTMSEENNFMIWHFLKVCYENGWMYKGHESVPWCPRCETAISQHEMLTEDYKEVVHESVFLRLPVVSMGDSSSRPLQYLLVWTTTPWTIPANIAVAVDKDIEYSLVEAEDGKQYWLAKDLVETVFKKQSVKTIKTVKGTELVGLKYEGPFDHLPAVKEVAEKNQEKFHTVVQTDPMIMPISTTEGTGLVHTAVSAGTEDFMLGRKLGLPMIPVIADNADYLETMGEFSGKNAKKHPELIIDFLKAEKEGEFLFSTLQYKHRYPACWRCKAELVWKVADEWYIAMDRPSPSNPKTLRERMIEVAKKITWMPEFGLDRELDWLKNMHDWLISKKNRYWGLSLPIYECAKCKTFEVLGSRDELKERAIKGWEQFEGKTAHKPYIDEVKIACKTCGGEVSRVEDVGNPWLDAGIVPFSTLTENNQGQPLYLKDKKAWKEWFPPDFITESFPGQFKNWFYAMIAMSAALEDTNPFKRVLGYATVVGEDGRAMHKSWGNYIEFNEAADKIGVDVMRWMYARQNPADNLLFGPKKADEVRRQFYLLLWNIYKFFVEYANLEQKEIVSSNTSKNILDQWILSRLAQTTKLTYDSLRNYKANEAVVSFESFVGDLSTWFLRRSRDRVWVNSEDAEDKKNFYETMQYVLSNLSIILSPIMPFITEEIYHNLTGGESVHLTKWPEMPAEAVNENLIGDMALVREIVEVGHRVRKEQKLKVRQPLQSINVILPKLRAFIVTENISSYEGLIMAELNVKEVKITQSKDSEVLTGEYDTTLSPELQLEGEMRELMRTIQQERKNKGIQIDGKINITIPHKFSPFAEQIKKKVLAETVTMGDTLVV